MKIESNYSVFEVWRLDHTWKFKYHLLIGIMWYGYLLTYIITIGWKIRWFRLVLVSAGSNPKIWLRHLELTTKSTFSISIYFCFLICYVFFSFLGGGGNNGGGGFTYPAMPIPPGYPYPPGAAAYTPPPAPMNSGPPTPGQLLNSREFQSSWQVNFTKLTLSI